MSHEYLSDRQFFLLLIAIDRDLAAAVRAAGCPQCGGKLHFARYWRHPSGAPWPKVMRHNPSKQVFEPIYFEAGDHESLQARRS